MRYVPKTNDANILFLLAKYELKLYTVSAFGDLLMEKLFLLLNTDFQIREELPINKKNTKQKKSTKQRKSIRNAGGISVCQIQCSNQRLSSYVVTRSYYSCPFFCALVRTYATVRYHHVEQPIGTLGCTVRYLQTSTLPLYYAQVHIHVHSPFKYLTICIF